MSVKPKFKGKCSRCEKTYYSTRKGEIIVCDCWRYCPLCGAEMQSYMLDLTPKTYGLNGKRDLAILMICTNHSSPFYSLQKPVEVVVE